MKIFSNLPRPAGTRADVVADVKPPWLDVQSEAWSWSSPTASTGSGQHCEGRDGRGALYNITQEAPIQAGPLVSSFLSGPRAQLDAAQEKPWPTSQAPSIFSGLLVFLNPCSSEQSNGRKASCVLLSCWTNVYKDPWGRPATCLAIQGWSGQHGSLPTNAFRRVQPPSRPEETVWQEAAHCWANKTCPCYWHLIKGVVIIIEVSFKLQHIDW